MKKRNLLIGALLTSIVIGAGTVNAANACSGGEGRHHGGFKMMRVMMDLDLTPEQRDRIKAIMDQQRKQMQSTRQQMHNVRKSLHEQATSDAYNQSKVRQLANEQAKFMADMMVERMDMMNKIHQILTPEQQNKLKSMKKHHRHDDDHEHERS